MTKISDIKWTGSVNRLQFRESKMPRQGVGKWGQQGAYDFDALAVELEKECRKLSATKRDQLVRVVSELAPVPTVCAKEGVVTVAEAHAGGQAETDRLVQTLEKLHLDGFDAFTPLVTRYVDQWEQVMGSRSPVVFKQDLKDIIAHLDPTKGATIS